MPSDSAGTMGVMTEPNPEYEVHVRVRDALEQGVRDRRFFVWLNIRLDRGTEPEFEDREVVKYVEEWLASLDPDDRPNSPPVTVWEGPNVEVRLSALRHRRHPAPR